LLTVTPKARDRISRAATLAAAAGLVAAAAYIQAGAASAAVPTSAGRPSARPSVPVLAWKPCDHGFQCTSAPVPLNYSDPRGQQISLAVISHGATGPGPGLGWLFFNGGGPNPQVATMATVYPNLPAAWRERYNIIMFDPRGMGYSSRSAASRPKRRRTS
jgi:hypothetical protein